MPPGRSKPLFPKLLQLLPKPLRHALLRRKATVEESATHDVVVEIAHTRESYFDAFQLVHDSYVGRGWITPQPNGLYLTQHHALPETTVFVMRKAGKCVGTVSLVLDSELGLPFEKTFPETAEIRAPGRRLAEIGSLAVAPELRGSGLTMCLFTAMWRYAKHHLGVSDLVVAVDANVSDYYEGLFGFRPVAEARGYAGFAEGIHALDDDPVIGLHQDMTTAQAFSRHYNFRPEAGVLNVSQLTLSSSPLRWERFPASDSTLDETRFKLPRALFQELFVGPDAMEPLEQSTVEYVRRFRTPQTVNVPPRLRAQLRTMSPMA